MIINLIVLGTGIDLAGLLHPPGGPFVLIARDTREPNAISMESLCESITSRRDQTFARTFADRIAAAAAARRGHNFIENFATYIHKTTLRTNGTKDRGPAHSF